MKDTFFKRLIYNKSYIHLYPLSKMENACSIINDCDLNEDSELASDIKELYKFIVSEGALYQIDKDEIQRQLDNCYRNKRVKILDEETNKKVVEEVTTERKGIGTKNDISSFSDRLNKLTNDAVQIERLAEAIERANINETHLPLCDMILKKNKIAKRVYVALLIIILAILGISFISMFF